MRHKYKVISGTLGELVACVTSGINPFIPAVTQAMNLLQSKVKFYHFEPKIVGSEKGERQDSQSSALYSLS